jgi:hypothetical protein
LSENRQFYNNRSIIKLIEKAYWLGFLKELLYPREIQFVTIGEFNGSWAISRPKFRSAGNLDQ